MPRLDVRPFTTFFSTATGWGTLTLTKREVTIRLEAGTLAVDRLVITLKGKPKTVSAKIVARAGQLATIRLG